MANGTGTATLNFGAYPGKNETFVQVTGISGISATSKVEAFIMSSDSTSDHGINDHMYVGNFINLTCENIVPGTGFDIDATSLEKLTGTWQVRYVWSD